MTIAPPPAAARIGIADRQTRDSAKSASVVYPALIAGRPQTLQRIPEGKYLLSELATL